MLKAIYPGSFDPCTNGHLNIIERAVNIFDELHVVIAVNVHKTFFFDPETRYELMCKIVEDHDTVKVHLWDKLIVDFAEKVGAKVILRGVRAIADFGHEFELSMINKGLNKSVETLIMPTDPKYFVLRSSAIKELVQLRGDVSEMVPPVVEQALEAKMEEYNNNLTS